MLQVAGIFQTIPSMALVGALYSFHGNWNAYRLLTALVIYAIFPILQNTITGLNGIDPSLEEAGIAFGMTKWERLKKFEIPLGHARHYVWDSDSSCYDYRDGDL